MTTVVLDTRRMVAVADRQTTSGTVKYEGSPKLIHYKRNGRECVAALTGKADHCFLFMAWFENQWYKPPMERSIPDKKCKAVVGVMYDDGTLEEYYESWLPLTIRAPYHAWGTGREIALGALDAGASPQKAIEIAMARDINTGFGIDITELKRHEQTRSGRRTKVAGDGV